MVAKSTARTVLTYTLLMKRAVELRKRDETAFSNLIGKGTTALVRGLVVMWVLRSNMSYFRVFYERKSGHSKGAKIEMAYIYGNPRHGKMYSFYQLKLMPTTPIGLIEKHLPVHFPAGKIQAHTRRRLTPLSVTNADGVLSGITGDWFTKKERSANPGFPSVPIAIDDTTGLAITKDECDSKHIGSRKTNGYCDTGVVPHSSISKSDWLRSVSCMPDIDQRLTVECALRCVNAAIALTAEFPAIRAVYLPASEASEEWSRGISNQTEFWINGKLRPAVALRHDGTSPTCHWYMPEIILFWAESFDSKTFDTEWAFLSLLVPPHGNPELDSSGAGKSPVMTTDLRGGDRAHQVLRAFKPGCGMAPTDALIASTPGLRQTRAENEFVAKWEEHRDRAWVRLFSAETSPLMTTDYPLAMKPGDLKDLVYGKFVIDSLPML